MAGKEEENTKSNWDLLSVPVEIRKIVFSFFSSREVGRLRLVCHAWKAELDDMYEYDIDGLDEETTHFQVIIALRIRKLHVLRLMSGSDGSPMLAYPNYVTSLDIGTLIHDNGTVSPQNVLSLLRLTARNIKNINITFTPLLSEYLFPCDGKLAFPHLRRLGIQTAENTVHFATGNSSLLNLFESSYIPNLEVLAVRIHNSSIFPTTLKSAFIGTTIQILIKHGKFLRSWTFFVNMNRLYPLNPAFTGISPEHLGRLMTITNIQRFDSTVIFPGLDMDGLWANFLKCQTRLVDIKINLYNQLNPEDPFFPAHLVINSAQTLRTIRIEDISNGKNKLDLALFQECTNLTSLELFGKFPWNMVFCKNFHRLPKDLEQLTIANLQIKTKGLIKMFQPQGFNKLSNISFQFIGDSDQYGITGHAFRQIMTSSTLMGISIKNWKSDRKVHVNTDFGVDEGLRFVIDIQRSNSTADWFKN